MFREQVMEFVANEVDFILAEYYEHIEETEWAIEVWVLGRSFVGPPPSKFCWSTRRQW